MSEDERRSIRKGMQAADASLNILLEEFGDYLSAKNKYNNVDGIEAIHIYLIKTYRWLPRDVKAMSYDEMRLALHTELQGWQADPGAVSVSVEDLKI